MWSFNAIGFTVFNIPGYLFFACIGFVAAVCTFIHILSEKNYPLDLNLKTAMISIVIALISSKIIGCISGIYRDIGLNKAVGSDSIIYTGIVYYGGLIGFLLAYGFFSKKYDPEHKAMDVLAVCIPLFHAFARVGCFTGGCCYGIEANSVISVNYTTDIMGQAVTANRIPVQLIEAGFNIILFLYLFCLFKAEDRKCKSLTGRYLLLYSIGRFFIELLRGDTERGVIGVISFSQVISILIWVYLSVRLLRQKLIGRGACQKSAE